MAACHTTFLKQVYDKYSAYDLAWLGLAWQSLHMAAAAASRGSTASGGTGCCDNQVMARNTADKKACAQICAQTAYRNRDAEVSIYGKKGKATMNGKIVGRFYHYSSHHGTNGGSKVSTCSSDETVITVIISVFVAVESSIHTSFVTRAIKISAVHVGRYRISVSPCTSGND